MKDNFLLKKEHHEIFDSLDNEEAGILIKGVFNYVLTGDSGLDGILKAVFIPIKKEIDRNEDKYKAICERNRKNGASGGRPKKEESIDNPNISQINPVGYFGKNTHISLNNHKSKKEKDRGMGEEKEKEKKNTYAEFVTMTNAEYEKLISTYGVEFTNRCIEVLDNYKGSSGKKYKSDYRAILNWVVEKVEKDKQKLSNNPSWMGKEIAENTATDEEIEEFIKQLGGE